MKGGAVVIFKIENPETLTNIAMMASKLKNNSIKVSNTLGGDSEKFELNVEKILKRGAARCAKGLPVIDASGKKRKITFKKKPFFIEIPNPLNKIIHFKK